EAQDIFRRQQAQTSQGQQQLLGGQIGLGGLGQIFELFNSGLLGQFGGLQSQQGLVGPANILNQQKDFRVGGGITGN
ncbi:unnamed protein product, partial [marine sediment metagenome]